MHLQDPRDRPIFSIPKYWATYYPIKFRMNAANNCGHWSKLAWSKTSSCSWLELDTATEIYSRDVLINKHAHAMYLIQLTRTYAGM
jgi:hypothetical protein